MSLPLELAMEAQEKNQSTEVMALPLCGGSKGDAMYVMGASDRVIVVLNTHFDDASDAVLGKVFLQVKIPFQ